MPLVVAACLVVQSILLNLLQRRPVCHEITRKLKCHNPGSYAASTLVAVRLLPCFGIVWQLSGSFDATDAIDSFSKRLGVVEKQIATVQKQVDARTERTKDNELDIDHLYEQLDTLRREVADLRKDALDKDRTTEIGRVAPMFVVFELLRSLSTLTPS